jgi:putative flippase GtrA
MKVRDIREVIRFAAVGGTGLIANIAILMFLIEILFFSEQFAAVLSTLFVLIGGFISTNWWVFAERKNDSTILGVIKRSGSYFLIMSLGKALNYVIYLGFIEANVWYPVAWFLASVLVFIGTFFFNRLVWDEV